MADEPEVQTQDDAYEIVDDGSTMEEVVAEAERWAEQQDSST